MINTCAFSYVHEFIDDLIYFNEKYGDTFECDGDNLEVVATFDRGADKCHS